MKALVGLLGLAVRFLSVGGSAVTRLLVGAVGIVAAASMVLALVVLCACGVISESQSPNTSRWSLSRIRTDIHQTGAQSRTNSGGSFRNAGGSGSDSNGSSAQTGCTKCRELRDRLLGRFLRSGSSSSKNEGLHTSTSFSVGVRNGNGSQSAGIKSSNQKTSGTYRPEPGPNILGPDGPEQSATQ